MTKSRRSVRVKPKPQQDSVPARRQEPGNAPRAEVYPGLLPEADYLVSCASAFGPYRSRQFGEKIILTFQVIEGRYAGERIQAYYRPSRHPTSRWYRAWALANDGLPSRNAKLSPRIFRGKIFRAAVSTVRPRHRDTGPDGKVRYGDELPKLFHYSKISNLLALEVANQPVCVTQNPDNPIFESEIVEGKVGNE